MDKKYEVTFDTTAVQRKPESKQEIAVISNNLNKVMNLTLSEIMRYLTPPFQYTISPSTFNGNRKNENWLQQQVFMLDFDSGVTPDEIIKKLDDHKIIVNGIYYTLSHTSDHPRFRIIIVSDEPIKDRQTAYNLRKGLTLALGADRSCFDSARFFFGGHNGEELSDFENKIIDLMNFSNIHLIAIDNLRTRILEKNGYSFNIYNRTTQFSPKHTPSPSIAPRNEHLEKLKKNHFDFRQAQEKVKIFDDFLNGKELKYIALFGLVTNLIHLKGGEKLIKEKMIKFNELGLTKYKKSDFAIIPLVKYYSYYPQRLTGWSPYEEDHEYINLIDAVITPRGTIQVIKSTSKISLAEAENQLSEAFQSALKSNTSDIFIIKTQTAIGKTRMLKDMINTTLCFPTHRLIKEVAKQMTVSHFVVPEIPHFLDNSLNESIIALYALGLQDEAQIKLKEIATSINNKYLEGDKYSAEDYLNKLEKAKQTKESIMTTHKRGIYEKYLNDTIIFDEDPLTNLLEIKHFELLDLIRIKEYYDRKSVIQELIKTILNTPAGELTGCEGIPISKKEMAQLVNDFGAKSNLVQFFQASAYIKSKQDPNIIHYLIKRELPLNKKIIIMSATINTELYQEMYGNRVQVVDIPLAESLGEIVQHTRKGYSRTYLKEANLDNLKAEIGEKPVITFLKHEDKFNTADNTHFGNCQGYNSLTGRDIVVVGTPHSHEYIYLFYAFAAGIDLTRIDTKLKLLKVDWKGFRFRFMTYEDEKLRNIQLSIIESELVQAIGRARSLRTNAKVDVYSNLPLLIATRIEF